MFGEKKKKKKKKLKEVILVKSPVIGQSLQFVYSMLDLQISTCIAQYKNGLVLPSLLFSG